MDLRREAEHQERLRRYDAICDEMRAKHEADFERGRELLRCLRDRHEKPPADRSTRGTLEL
jgi:hypothetical protein